jgi:hypothetical protein
VKHSNFGVHQTGSSSLNCGRWPRPAHDDACALPSLLKIRDPRKQPSQFDARRELATCLKGRMDGRDLIFSEAEHLSAILASCPECGK